MNLTMKTFLILCLLGLTACVTLPAPDRKHPSKNCPTCDVDHCPKTSQECFHGLVRDECNCCREGVCLLFEKEKCLNLKLFRNTTETDLKKFSVCGEYAECLPRTDLKAGETEESVCQCERRQPSCGKDNATYPSICQLREAGTELRHSGPCRMAPEVASELQPESTVEGDRFSLNCEAKGFPIPLVHWEFEGLNGLFGSLPGDDHSIAVNSRGGPEPFTVTSWLMIEELRSSDSGMYICVANNSEGVTRSAVSVHVVKKNS